MVSSFGGIQNLTETTDRHSESGRWIMVKRISLLVLTSHKEGRSKNIPQISDHNHQKSEKPPRHNHTSYRLEITFSEGSLQALLDTIIDFCTSCLVRSLSVFETESNAEKILGLGRCHLKICLLCRSNNFQHFSNYITLHNLRSLLHFLLWNIQLWLPFLSHFTQRWTNLASSLRGRRDLEGYLIIRTTSLKYPREAKSIAELCSVDITPLSKCPQIHKIRIYHASGTWADLQTDFRCLFVKALNFLKAVNLPCWRPTALGILRCSGWVWVKFILFHYLFSHSNCHFDTDAFKRGIFPLRLCPHVNTQSWQVGLSGDRKHSKSWNFTFPPQ